MGAEARLGVVMRLHCIAATYVLLGCIVDEEARKNQRGLETRMMTSTAAQCDTGQGEPTSCASSAPS